jgi:hypothetical protein
MVNNLSFSGRIPERRDFVDSKAMSEVAMTFHVHRQSLRRHDAEHNTFRTAILSALRSSS